jgi:fructosamine-3-kinase
VFAKIDVLVGPPESPSRLHGDLWNGNVLADEIGLPVLIDPAPYGGHREVDLAMMRLFGGFSERVFAAYEAQYPLSPGAAERIPLWQLYPLLVHVNLFAGSYVATLERTLRAVV